MRAATVAVRCPVRRGAISPKVSPGPSAWADSPPSVWTAASPCSMK